jgi:hypothetical protein
MAILIEGHAAFLAGSHIASLKMQNIEYSWYRALFRLTPQLPRNRRFLWYTSLRNLPLLFRLRDSSHPFESSPTKATSPQAGRGLRAPDPLRRGAGGERRQRVAKTDASIDSMLVKFLAVVKKLTSEKTKHIYYKVVAEIKTPKGKEKHAYWFDEQKSFLRQKHKADGKNSIKVDFNSKQRAAIQKLVAKFEASHTA